MKFLQSLSESRLLSSTSAFRKFSARQVAELVYLHVIAIRILGSESLSQHFTTDYAARSVRYLGFAKWYQNATDLHLLLHALMAEDVDLKMPEASRDFKETLYFDEQEIRYWLRDISHGHISEPRTHRLFLHLDGQFQIKNGSMKAIRRLVMDWPHCTPYQKQLAMTRLLQIMRVRSRQSDVLVELEKLATKLRLELKNVDNPETGDEAKHDGSDPEFVAQQPKKKGILKSIAATAAGAVLGYHAIKSLSEGVVHQDRKLIVIESPTINQLLLLKRDAGYEGVRALIKGGKVFAWDGSHMTFAEAKRVLGEGIEVTLWNGYVETSREDSVEDIWENDCLCAFYEGAAPVQVGDEEDLIVMREDADAGVTSAGDIAPVVKVLGAVQRRRPKARKKKK